MSTKKKFKITLLTIVAIFTLVFSGTVQAQKGAPTMFGDAGDVQPSANQPVEPFVVRERFVTVNTAALFDAAGTQLNIARLPEVNLNLFSDARFTGVITRAWQDGWGTYWYGNLKGVRGGYFYMTVVNNIFMTHVASTRGVFESSMTANGYYRVIQIDQSKFVDHDPAATYQPSGSVDLAASSSPTADISTSIDIMVIYTDDARLAAGGTDSIKATIQTALNETNTAYVLSGVKTQLRLVHVEEIAYAETGNIAMDLANFTGSYTVKSLRNTYGADMVGVITESGGIYCGLANAIMASDDNAYMVTTRSCATGYYSFGHEFAHLQGARHDIYVDSGSTPYIYGHGYVHTGSTAGTRWRTVMAYNDKCSDLGYNCTRLQYFSNPAKKYGGAPTGATTAKNYQVLNNTALTVANFRTQVLDGANFTSTFKGIKNSAGWSSVSGSWISAVNYYWSSGVANNLALAKHTGNYGDITYEVDMYKWLGCNNCGNTIIIRGNPASIRDYNLWAPSYMFSYTNSGFFIVLKETLDSEVVLSGSWVASDAIHKDSWNMLKVVAVGSFLKFYINGTLVWSGTDTSLRTGTVGFGFYRGLGDTGHLYVDYARVTNTPTADINPAVEIVAPGVPVPGGSIYQAP